MENENEILTQSLEKIFANERVLLPDIIKKQKEVLNLLNDMPLSAVKDILSGLYSEIEKCAVVKAIF
ncbi:hypothetical protein [Daejeonella oryzae]|uniref:hypothetical protein n=1 Tax=Daejeonella oryzae TaxID=1122943 RepID=UPI0003F5FEE5|nr:hypothetical protein [Daejeonella oryzae]